MRTPKKKVPSLAATLAAGGTTLSTAAAAVKAQKQSQIKMEDLSFTTFPKFKMVHLKMAPLNRRFLLDTVNF